MKGDRPDFHKFVTEPIWFYFPRFGRDDRRHAVPNAVSYLLLAKTIADNYVELRRAAKRSVLSASPPVFDWSGPRAVMRPSVDLRDDFRIDLSSRREEYATADIRAFFHSIYTHSIPWTIYGKAWAKDRANRDNKHFGNLIDLLSRNMQDGQTIGLPVGPDTSRLLAEVVASGIDVQLRDRLKVAGRDASRYIDDYTISSSDGHSSEMLIAALRESAAHFELELNNEKSEIFSTATRHDIGWKQAVRSIIPKVNLDLQTMQGFFYEVGRFSEMHPSINIEKFAFSNARLAFMRAGEWKRTQSFLINAYRRNSTLVTLLVEFCILRQRDKNDVDLENLKEFIDHRMPVLALSNRTGEIIWLLFLSIRLNVVLDEKAVAPLCLIQNAMVALLVMFASSRGLIRGNIDSRFWNSFCTSEGLRGQMWLYAYEAPLCGIARDVSTEYLEIDQYFSALYSRKVRFFEIDRGLESVGTTIRALRNENYRSQRVRADFLEDFEVNIEEYDDNDFSDDELVEEVDY